MSIQPQNRDAAYREQQTNESWAVHQALVLMERARPELNDNPASAIVRSAAYETFALAMERLGHG